MFRVWFLDCTKRLFLFVKTSVNHSTSEREVRGVMTLAQCLISVFFCPYVCEPWDGLHLSPTACWERLRLLVPGAASLDCEMKYTCCKSLIWYNNTAILWRHGMNISLSSLAPIQLIPYFIDSICSVSNPTQRSKWTFPFDSKKCKPCGKGHSPRPLFDLTFHFIIFCQRAALRWQEDMEG